MTSKTAEIRASGTVVAGPAVNLPLTIPPSCRMSWSAVVAVALRTDRIDVAERLILRRLPRQRDVENPDHALQSMQLMNIRIALKELAISGAEYNPSTCDKKRWRFLRDILLGNRWLVREMLDHCQDFVAAATLPQLVDKMNALQGDRAVELDLVRDAVERYDATIARGTRLMNDEQLRRIAVLRQYRGDRIRLCEFQPINDVKALPLIAVREFIISRKSLGGIKTDLESRVLDASGQPIAGLYAVGEAAGFGGGGVHGLALEGTFLGGCILSGRIAAASINGKTSSHRTSSHKTSLHKTSSQRA
jgi:predicted oxidoreductase